MKRMKFKLNEKKIESFIPTQIYCLKCIRFNAKYY